MSELVAHCPRCKSSQITFDLLGAISTEIYDGWQMWFEAFCICRHCKRSTVFILSQEKRLDTDLISRTGLANLPGAVNHYMEIEGYICIEDMASVTPPEHLPDDVLAAFKEGATCLAVNCYNAAGTMFRLCVDLATRPILPEKETPGLNSKTRRDLGLRLPWLFDNGFLPEGLRELSLCIKEDGNDAAHAGTLKKENAEDLLDFTIALLERIYTEPKRIQLAQERRMARRAKPED